MSTMHTGHRRSRPSGDSLQYIANLVTVVTGVSSAITLFSGQFIWTLPAIAALVFTFYSLKARRWRSGVLGLAVVSLAAFAVGVSLYHHAGREPGATAPSLKGGGGQTAVAQAPASSAAASAPASTVPQEIISSPAESAPPVLLDSYIVLKRDAAADVDTSRLAVLENQAGADGNLDLYFDASEPPTDIIAHDSERIFQVGPGVADPYGA